MPTKKGAPEAGSNRGARDLLDGVQNTTIVTRWRALGACSRHPSITKGDLAVYWAILDRIGPTGQAWPSFAQIATDANLTKRGAAKSLERLRRLGFLTVVSGSRTKSNRYRIGPAGSERQDTTLHPLGSEPQFTKVVNASSPGVVNASSPEPALLNLLQEPTHTTRSNPSCNQDENALPNRLAPVGACEWSAERVVSEYHRQLPSAPPVLQLTAKRRQLIRSAAKQLGELCDTGQPDWPGFFEFCRLSPYLRGETRAHRQPDLTFLLTRALEICEGQYSQDGVGEPSQAIDARVRA